MRHMIRVWVVGFIVLGMMSCTSTREDTQHAQAKRACERTCGAEKNVCVRTCEDSCKQCQKAEDKKTAQLYKNYIYEQHEQGKRVALQLQSFRDPLQCRKSSCDCPADYRVCMSSCTGQIYKSLQITPVCC